MAAGALLTTNFTKVLGKSIHDSLLGEDNLWFAVGSGSDSWDVTSIPSPTVSDVKLTNEIYRVKLDLSESMKYVLEDSDPDVISAEPTSVIRILGTSNTVGSPIREYGLFNGDATQAKDSGTLILKGTHPKIVLAQLTVFMKYIYIDTRTLN